MSVHFDRFDRNIQRVDNLCSIFEIVKSTSNRPTVKEADVLRAAIVFLHSALEDYLRGILTELLPVHDTKNLDNIALYQTEGRAAKFSLGALKAYEDLTVSDLIKKSIEEQMHQTSFNDTNDIAGWLNRIGISIDDLSVDLAKLNTTIKRRHKIVHEVDANQNSGRGNHNAASINLLTVKSWEENVIAFVNSIEVKINEITSPN